MKSRRRCSAVSSSIIITIYIPIIRIFESAGSDVVFIVSIFEGVAGAVYDIPVILIVCTVLAVAVAPVMSNDAVVLTVPLPPVMLELAEVNPAGKVIVILSVVVIAFNTLS